MFVKAWDRHDKELAALTKLASQDLVTLIRKYPSAGVEDIQLFMKGLSDKYGKQAAASAFQAIRNSREAYDLWDLLELPVVMDPATAEQVHAATAWALQTKKIPGGASGAESLHRLVGVLVRLVNQPARDTVRESALRAGVAWARVPTAKACDFCLMLSSRGAVYESKTVALAASGNRGSRPEGASYHDNCNCRAIESYSDADLPQIVRDLEDEWAQVTDKAVGSGEKQRAAWNRHVKETRPLGSAIREVNPDGTAVVWPKGDMLVLPAGLAATHAKFNPSRPTAGGHTKAAIHEIQKLIVQEKLHLPSPKTFVDSEHGDWWTNDRVTTEVLSSPDSVERDKNGYKYRKTIAGPDGPVTLVAAITPSRKMAKRPTKAGAWTVRTVYPQNGANVQELREDGTIVGKEEADDV